MKLQKITLLSVFTVVGLSLISCSYAKKEDLEALRQEIQQTRNVSDEALNIAKGAQRTAQEASSRARLSEEAINRGFKKSMHK